jgi:hypothetical protein
MNENDKIKIKYQEARVKLNMLMEKESTTKRIKN